MRNLYKKIIGILAALAGVLGAILGSGAMLDFSTNTSNSETNIDSDVSTDVRGDTIINENKDVQYWIDRANTACANGTMPEDLRWLC